MRFFRRRPLSKRLPIRRAVPRLESLEDRALPATGAVFAQFQSAVGVLALPSENAPVTVSVLPGDFVQVSVGSQVESSNPLAGNFDPALAGANAHSIQTIQLLGAPGLDHLVLGNLNVAGRLTVTTDGILEIQGQVSASGPIQLNGASLLLSGQVHAFGIDDSINVKAGNVLQSGLLEADGGAINVDFTGHYVATTSAVTQATSYSAGNGGLVEIDGGSTGTLFSSGQYQANAFSKGQAGDIDLFGAQVQLVGAAVNASGSNGGGWIRVGGDSPSDIASHGGATAGISFANTTSVDASTTITADALNAGNGGHIVVWSQQTTTFAGTLNALGAGALGAGGLIEVSSAGQLTYGGHANATATSGKQGNLLLDPENLIVSAGAGLPEFALVNPAPSATDTFGAQVVQLSNGNIVVTDPSSSLTANFAGAVFLYDGVTGALIGSLTGSTANDKVGSGGVTGLTNGNFVVGSPSWQDNGVSVGAATWVDGSGGPAEAVAEANSFFGSTSDDEVGTTVTALTNGNYVVASPYWQSGGVIVGAVTWGDGSTGSSGAVSAGNSLVGSTSGDEVGIDGVTALTNGNYVVDSPFWQNPNGTGGAATWGDGAGGTVGPVSVDNSITGDVNSGQTGGIVVALTDGNYVVASSGWESNSNLNDALGAVTWGNGATGTVEIISDSNSLVGSTTFDEVGSNGVFALANGNYVVDSSEWQIGENTVGAVTWCEAGGGTVGPVTADNSLTGTSNGDQVGSGGVTVLTSGNFVVASPSWQNGPDMVGAVTLCQADGSTTGPVSLTNSLTGSTNGDTVGSDGVVALSNGNYVVDSPEWQSGGSILGAITWGDAGGSTTGPVTAANSLIGATNADFAGYGGVTALTNGNYVISSPFWQNNGVAVGAVTWVDGSAMVSGTINSGNSLIGSTSGDSLGNGGVVPLSNGNYLVTSTSWQSAGAQVGAITWANGANGQTMDGNNTVDAGNSLIGPGNQTYLAEAVGLHGGESYLADFNGGAVGGTVTLVQLAATIEAYGTDPAGILTVSPSFITDTLDTGSDVILQASNDIEIESPIIVNNPSGNGGNLTLQAGRQILIFSDIVTDNGDITMIANDTAADGVVDSERTPGSSAISMFAGTSINAGRGDVSITISTGAGNTNLASDDITAGDILCHNLTLINDGPGDVSMGGVNTGGGADMASVTATGNLTVQSTFDISQAGALSQNDPDTINVAGTTSLTAAGPIILDTTGNQFAGTVTYDDTFNSADLPPGDDDTDNTDVTINATGNLTLATTGPTLSIQASASGTLAESGPLDVTGPAFFGGGTIALGDSNNSFQGTVTLDSAGSDVVTDSAGLTLGDLTLNGSTTLTAPSIDFSGSLDVGAQSLSLTSITPAEFGGATTLAGGSITDTAGMTVTNGGMLSGTGTLNAGAGAAAVLVEAGGTLSPGMSPTGLTINGDLTLSTDSTLSEQIQGLSSYGLLTVNGAVNLGDATIQGVFLSPYVPTEFDQFQMLDNGTGAAVTGTFAQGPSVVVGSNTLGINYAADANNDMVLTVQGPPASVTSLPTYSPLSFNVSWSGTEYAQGHSEFNVYVADNGGAFTLWQSHTTQTSASYTGQLGHTYAFFAIYTDDVGNQAPVSQASTTIKLTPTITWSNPADIVFGVALGVTQLDALASVILGGVPTNVPGTFTYTPGAGTVLSAGADQTLSVTFTPTDSTDYFSNQATASINVDAATPTFSGLSSPSIHYGTATTVVSGHLNGNAGGQNVPMNETVQVTIHGVTRDASLDANDDFSTTFNTAALGVAGSAYTIGFSYAGDANFNGASSSSTLTVTPATPTITWSDPATITYGTLLGATQLDATASTAGTFTYTLANGSTPATGALLHAGANQTLNVSFTPSDGVDFTSATGQVTIDVDAKTLTATIVGTPNKTYDGTTAATLTPANFQLTGLVGSDSFTVTQTAGAYNSKDTTAASVAATLTAGNFTAGAGTLRSDYVFPTSAAGAGTISAKTLTASIVGTPTKVYDGTTAVALTASNFHLTGLVGSESFTVTQTAGTFDSANTTAATVTASLSASNFTAAVGTLASDYTLPTTASGAGSITPASQSITFNVTSPIPYSDPVTLTATGGGSGNAVTFSIVSGPGVVNGNTLTFTGTGSVVIQANQAGNADYNAASPVQRTIMVGATFTATSSENENATPTVVTVASVLGSHYSDPDGAANTKPGMAIFQTDGAGTWQYSTNGSTWTTIGAVSQAQALLLTGSNDLRFMPAANSNGVAHIYFVAWDGSQGTPGAAANISVGGGITPFSTNAGALAMTVNPVPQWIGGGAALTSLLPGTYSATNQQTPAGNTIASVFGAYFQDNNQAVSVGVAINSVSSTKSGTWQFKTSGSSTWTNFPTISTTSVLLLSANDSIRFVPNTGFVGTVSIKALAWDGSVGTHGLPPVNPATLASSAFSSTALTATASVNHAPTLSTLSFTGTSVAQYATGAPITVASLIARAGYSDPDGNNVPEGIAVTGAALNQGGYQYMLAGGAWQALPSVSTSAALLLPSTVSLRYIAGSQLGSGATLTFQGWDETQGLAGQTYNIGTAGSPGAFSTASATLSIAVTASTNQAPTLGQSAFAESAVTINTTSAPVAVSKILTQAGYADPNGSKSPQGIAITSVGGSAGVVQYMLAGGSWQTLPSVSSSAALLLPSTASLRLVAGGALGTESLTFAGWDETQGTAGQLFNMATTGGATAFSTTSATISVPVGQAPSWTASVGAALPSLPPGSYMTSNNASPAGATVATVFGSFFQDIHQNPTVGIAVTATSGAGTWQYSLNGTSWTGFSMLSKTNALLLSATDLIRFVPTGSTAVTGTLTAYAWDGSFGLAGGTANLTSAGTGGASAFSATMLTATSAFNTAPTLGTTSVTLNAIGENAASTPVTAATLLQKASYVDPDGTRVLSGIAITGDTGPGTWQWLNGTVWTALPSVSSSSAFLLASTTQVRFKPADNQAANTNSSATLTYLAWDQTGGVADSLYHVVSQGGDSPFSSQAATAAMAVNFVKQAPSWTAGVSAAFTPVLGYSTSNNATPNPAGDTVAAVFGSAFFDTPGTPVGIAVTGVTGSADGTWQYSTNGGTTWTNVSTVATTNALLLSASAKLRFLPNKSFSGTATLTAYAWDGTGNFTGAVNLPKAGLGGSGPFSSTSLTATCLVNSAPTLSA